jgi:hypothetical protein
MTSRDFCYWLQGFFELRSKGERDDMSAEQIDVVKRHLALVFKHEIDPSIDRKDPVKKVELDKIHESVGKLIARC